MADPKYANLPGIDVNSPDVYESSELPEAEQNVDSGHKIDNTSEGVEQTTINPDAAFRAFKGKSLSVEKTDFSDSVGKSRTIGYFTEKTEYELAEENNKQETVQQKLQRLQHEIRELGEEVNKIKENVIDAGASESLSPVSIGRQLEYLQHLLTDLHLETLLGSEACVDLADPQGALRKRLLTELESFKTATAGKGKEASESDHILYQLLYRPDQTLPSKVSKLSALEERLIRLESVIGQNNHKMNVLTMDTDNKSLIGAVATLNSKLSLLDISNTETVEARLNAVLLKIQQIAEKKEKEPQTDPDNQRKIAELYSAVKKWETTAEVLPQVVDRLQSLQELHEQALQFSQALVYLNAGQQEVINSIKVQGDLQQQLQSSLADNATSFQQNVESIDKRLKNLTKS